MAGVYSQSVSDPTHGEPSRLRDFRLRSARCHIPHPRRRTREGASCVRSGQRMHDCAMRNLPRRQPVLVVRLGDVMEGQDRNDPRHVIQACSHQLRTRENARLRRREDRGSLTTTESPSACRSPTRQNAPPALLEGQLRKRPTLISPARHRTSVSRDRGSGTSMVMCVQPVDRRTRTWRSSPTSGPGPTYGTVSRSSGEHACAAGTVPCVEPMRSVGSLTVRGRPRRTHRSTIGTRFSMPPCSTSGQRDGDAQGDERHSAEHQ
jgi:hypothetical protein